MEWRLTGMLNWIELNGMEWDRMDWIGMTWHGTKPSSFKILKEVSHESFSSTSAAFRFWGKSRTIASISHLPLSDFEGGLARKLRFRIFHFHFWREVSHESFFFTSSSSRFWGKSRTKASFSHLPLSVFEGSLARKLRFHICHFQFLREVSHKSFIFISATFRFWGKSRTKCVLELQFLTLLRVVLLYFATQSLQIALQWLRQGCLEPRLRA